MLTNQQKRNLMAEEIWLNYFNTYLYEHKLITAEQRNKMHNEITFRCNRKRQQADRER